jgi:hypothetical protein
MKGRTGPSLALVFLFVASTLVGTVSGETVFTKEEAKQYLEFQQKLYPEKGNLYQKLLAAFPDKETFTVYEITAVTDPKIKLPRPDKKKRSQESPVPTDAFSARQARAQLAAVEKNKLGQEKLWSALIEKYGLQDWYTPAQLKEIIGPAEAKKETPNQKGTPPAGTVPARRAQEELAATEQQRLGKEELWNALLAKYGPQDWYTAQQLRDVEENGKTPAKDDNFRDWSYLAEKARILEAAPDRTLSGGFKAPRIRQNWRDVLYDEDPSQIDLAAKKLGDLVGATFSYVHDGTAQTDTWSALGALILPWQHAFNVTEWWTPSRIALAPSASVNRVNTSGDPKKETDSLLFRLGGYSDWDFDTKPVSGLQLRAAFVYATDTGGRASLPGYEFDIEPRWQSEVASLGYKNVLIKKEPLKADLSDRSVLEYQVRAWLHIEGGEVQDNGKTWDPVGGSFFRVGPSVQFQLNAPKLVFGKEFSLTALYSYLSPVSGSDAHNSFAKVTAAFTLLKDEQLNHKISLTADYQKGGLNFTKEDVDILTIGLGVLF